jgi:hypothetical protein
LFSISMLILLYLKLSVYLRRLEYAQIARSPNRFTAN